MNIFNDFREKIEKEVEALSDAGDLPADLDGAGITVEPPRDPSHGDLATNAAMALAKSARRNPRQIAELLAPKLADSDAVSAVDIAGPGFINLRLTDTLWHDLLRDVLETGTDYGGSTLGAGQKVNVEYVSANPTGPLHVGHVRGAVFGDALANLLSKAGFDVTKEYYINDAGAQIDTLARSVYLRYREALGQEIGEIPEGLYPGEYLVSVGHALAEKFGDRWLDQPEEAWLKPVREEATAAMMALIKADLAALGIAHDVFSSELALHDSDQVAGAIEVLRSKGLIYTGVLEPPKGKKPADWKPREQLLFRATELGEEADQPLTKADGSSTYFAADIAYHYDKVRRGAEQMIDVWGADHAGHVKRTQLAIDALTGGDVPLDVRVCQMVRLFRGGEPVRMSKRAGSFVTLADLKKEVGRDVIRFIMLTRRNDAPLDFDFDKVLEQSRDNPVFYVQYAHARIQSVRRKAAEMFPAADISPEALAEADLARLSHPAELALLKKLAQWPRIVETAALSHEPHRVAFYLNELAGEFHGLWNQGNDDPGLRFLMDGDEALSRARIALITGVRLAIASGLAILGVEPVEEMH